MPYKNKEEYKKFQKEYRKTHREKAKKYAKEYHKTHKEECKEYFEAHKEKIENYQKKYRETHTKQRNEWWRNRRENPQYRLSNNISRRIRQSLKNGENSYRWESLVNYTLNDLIEHLEKQFTAEVNWNNYGFYWHVDHIIPISVFNFDNSNQLDFKRCWALENLQPLEKSENQEKHTTINKPFQLNLKM